MVLVRSVTTILLDPFGNYLCQKLLEYSTDEQRNMICESVAHDLVGISLNMHGTRAVQKMIDFLSTQRQVRNHDFMKSQSPNRRVALSGSGRLIRHLMMSRFIRSSWR